MELRSVIDLVVDEYSNYYSVVELGLDKEKDYVVLVNSFMVNSYKDILHLNEPYKSELSSHESQYIGLHAMDILKNRIKGIEEGRLPGNIFKIEEVINFYGVGNVYFKPLYEKNIKILT
ncbi:hypothetical protein LGK95_10160 [Clostridium algoriphilum]|uniref:hypothetical protein n=1 Tax=Clostridium algoriphilum TaxID=198347 RepID=UPI001CF5DA9B|nr:hypothetical protein [Clostridium algoriphilum]MCB2293884.1 hypothetical protein [Clostridium algoriphilum]